MEATLFLTVPLESFPTGKPLQMVNLLKGFLEYHNTKFDIVVDPRHVMKTTRGLMNPMCGWFVSFTIDADGPYIVTDICSLVNLFEKFGLKQC